MTPTITKVMTVKSNFFRTDNLRAGAVGVLIVELMSMLEVVSLDRRRLIQALPQSLVLFAERERVRLDDV